MLSALRMIKQGYVAKLSREGPAVRPEVSGVLGPGRSREVRGRSEMAMGGAEKNKQENSEF